MPRQIIEASAILEGFRPDDTPILHHDAALLVEEGRVSALGSAAEIRRLAPDATVLGGRDQVLIPGLVNAHHHVGLTPLQLGSPDHPLELWFASRLALRDVDLYLDTLYSAFEMLRSGVTTVQHLHSRAPGSAEAVVDAGRRVMQAYSDVGMRASYSMALRDQNRLVYEDDKLFVERVPEDIRPWLRAYFERFTLPLRDQVAVFDELRAAAVAHPSVAVQLAPANLHWLSDEALGTAAELSARHDLPMHMHVVETRYQKAYAFKRTGGTALAHLDRMGLAGPRLTVGHGVWMTADDIALCAHTGTRICHNCSSNMRLKSGLAPVNHFLAEGIPVALGIDEAGINDDRDMLQEMRLVLRAHREPGLDAPHPSPAQVLRMATEHGAGTTPFAGMIGSLSPGRSADCVLFDWAAVTTPWQSRDIPLVDVLVQRAKCAAVKTVMVAGEVVLENGRFTKIDEPAVMADITVRLAAPLTDAEQERRVMAKRIFPHVRAFYDGYDDDLADDPFTRSNSRR